MKWNMKQWAKDVIEAPVKKAMPILFPGNTDHRTYGR